MSIKTTLEYWNEAPDRDVIHVITHSRQKFYGREIYWYEFSMDGMPIHELGHEDILPEGFLRVIDTDYYEFAGDVNLATKSLTDAGFTIIVKGNDI